VNEFGVVETAILFMFFFCGCSNDDMPDGATTINVDYIWDLDRLSVSPEIHLANVPEGVDRLTIYFYDVTANNYSHGGGSLSYDGSGIIPAGAFTDFKGMTNMFGTPTIKVTVDAFNKDGQLIGRGAIAKAPPNG
jgi:hypothetical protein